jgi:hypothetical protein
MKAEPEAAPAMGEAGLSVIFSKGRAVDGVFPVAALESDPGTRLLDRQSFAAAQLEVLSLAAPASSDRGRDAVVDAVAADILARTGVVPAGLRHGMGRNAGAAKAPQDAVRLRGPDGHHGGHQEGGDDEQKLESGHEISFLSKNQ